MRSETENMKTVLFYGDSNTWGFDPETGNRYSYEIRWTSICASILGEGYCCIPSGMNGRTTIFDDPLKGCRNGSEGIDYALQSHKPLDLLVLMIGTNDMKYTDAAGSAAGLEQLVLKIMTANERYSLSSPVFPDGAKILLISPVLLNENIDETGRHDAMEESRKLSALYKGIADKYELAFMDAADITPPADVDGVHLSPEGHRKIGQAVAARIADVFRG